MDRPIAQFSSKPAIRLARLGLVGVTAFVIFLAPALGQEVKVYVSSKAGDRITPKPSLHFEARRGGGEPAFRINDGITYQTIAGFGASFLEAGMICLNSLEPDQQEAVLRALFDPEDGAGFSAMKTVIAATDGMPAGPFYTYDDTPGDVEMKHFSIQRDLDPNGLITYIKRARKYGMLRPPGSHGLPSRLDAFRRSEESGRQSEILRRSGPVLPAVSSGVRKERNLHRLPEPVQ
jgi:hypothetical protein